MAISLSSSQSSTLEPLKKNRWVLQFTSVPGNSSDAAAKLAFCAHTCARPTITYAQTEIQRLNERFYTAGKPTWSEMSMSFYDYIDGPTSVSDILWNWNQKIYSPITGAMGFKVEYAASGTLAMLDPSGGVVQIWNLFYVWPATLAYNDLSADDETPVEVNATFRYDYAVKGIDVNTTPSTAA